MEQGQKKRKDQKKPDKIGKRKKQEIPREKYPKLFIFPKETGITLKYVEDLMSQNLDGVDIKLPNIYIDRCNLYNPLISDEITLENDFINGKKSYLQINIYNYIDKLTKIDLKSTKDNSLQETIFDFIKGDFEISAHKFFDRVRLFYSFYHFAQSLLKNRTFVPWLDFDVPFETISKSIFERQLVIQFKNQIPSESEPLPQKPIYLINNLTSNEHSFKFAKSFQSLDITKFYHFSFWEDIEKVNEIKPYSGETQLKHVGNLYYLFRDFRFALKPILCHPDSEIYDKTKKRSDKEVQFFVNDLIKSFGRIIFQLSSFSSFKRNDDPYLQKNNDFFHWIETLFRYLVEPTGLYKSIDEYQNDCIKSTENIINYIIDNPWLPEFEWIPNVNDISIMKPMESGMKTMFLQLQDKSVSEFFEHLSVFKSKSADSLVWNNVHKFYINYQSAFPLLVFIQMTKPIFSHPYALPIRSNTTNLIGHLFSLTMLKLKFTQTFAHSTNLETSIARLFNSISVYFGAQKQLTKTIFEYASSNCPDNHILSPLEILEWLKSIAPVISKIKQEKYSFIPKQNKYWESMIQKFHFYLTIPIRNETLLNCTYYSKNPDNVNEFIFWLSPFEPSKKDQIHVSSNKFPNYTRTHQLNKDKTKVWEMYHSFIQVHDVQKYWKSRNFLKGPSSEEKLMISNIKENQIILKIEFCFFLMFFYLNMVYTSFEWEKNIIIKALDHCYKDFTEHRKAIMPFMFGGGDCFVMLVAWATSLKKSATSATEFLESWYFKNWIRSRDLTESIRTGFRDYSWEHHHRKEMEHFERDHQLNDLDHIEYQAKISISNDWTVPSSSASENFEKAMNILNRFAVAFADGDHKRPYLRNLFRYQFDFKDPQDKVSFGQGNGVEQTATTLICDMFNEQLNIDCFKSEDSTKGSIDQSKITSMQLITLGKVFNYMFLQNIETHIEQPPLFWKLIGFGDRSNVEIQDMTFFDRKKAIDIFEMIIDDSVNIENVFGDANFHLSDKNLLIPSISGPSEKYHYFMESFLDQLYSQKISKDTIYHLKEGFNMTKTEFQPSYKVIHSHFHNLDHKQLDAMKIVQIMKIESEEHPKSDRYHSKHYCVDCLHQDEMNNVQCPISNLMSWLTKATSSQMRQFLFFVTGKNAICKGSEIIINIHKSAYEKLPVAHVCSQELDLFWCEKYYQNFEECYRIFEKALETAISEKCFGLQ
jgi:hypothetical protein